MWRQLQTWLMLAPALAVAALIAFGRALLRGVLRVLVATLQLLAALILLFEEWGWQPLVAALGRLARFPLWAHAELLIAGLPPYGALLALIVPTSILFPLKIAAVWLLAQGHALSAAALLVFAKVVSTALIARVFLLTKPALMRIGWFAALYDWFVPWKEALFAAVRASWAWRWGRMVKLRLKRAMEAAWHRWQPQVTAILRDMKLRASLYWAELRRHLERTRMRLTADARRLLNRR